MKIIKTEQFNTNNAWGFGGASGTSTKYDNGITVIAGRNSHRHTGTSSANCVYVDVEEGKDAFSVKLRRATKDTPEVASLNGVDTISVLRHDDNYMALVGNHETFSRWGLEYKRIRTIKIDTK
jgi:hypothetical protein